MSLRQSFRSARSRVPLVQVECLIACVLEDFEFGGVQGREHLRWVEETVLVHLWVGRREAIESEGRSEVCWDALKMHHVKSWLT